MGGLIVIIGLIIMALWVVYYIIHTIYMSIEKAKFKLVSGRTAKKIRGLSDILDNLFKPDKRVSIEDIKRFRSDHKDAIDATDKLLARKHVFDDVIKKDGIKVFKDKLDENYLNNCLKENNTVYDSIQRLKYITSTSSVVYNRLFSNNHYCSFSEMEDFKTSLKEVEDLSKTLLPKYAEYLEDTDKNFIKKYKEIDSDRNTHNYVFVRKELELNKSYFDTVSGSYPLDPQQRDSIVKLEDNCLVIASAGSGKTSTILGKAKYLVECRNIDPSKILLITYTRKAANELHERMNIEGITCSTFHALAYNIIAKVTGQAPSICDPDLPLVIFHKMINTNENFLHAINNYIINQQSLMGLEHEYTDAFTYYEDRKKYGIQALFPDVDGNIIFTRSEEEKRLVSILTRLGIPFRYENPYKIRTSTPERRQYKPDFTIYYKDYTGNWKWIYLEHFAIDANGNVPQWFGEGTRGGWRTANQKYNDGILWKRSIHNQYSTTLIETSSADFMDGTVEEKLKAQLRRYGIPVKERTDEELYEMLVNRNKKVEKSVYTLILSFITLMKANERTINTLLGELSPLADVVPNERRNKIILSEIIKPFFEEYQNALEQRYEIDFTDAIIQATELCRKGLWMNYDYILVDEFQDISIDRYKFLQALRKDSAKTKLFCVGDDWQSIFRFAGSDMSLVYNFENYFGYTEYCKIETTYRFHQPLIDKSSTFIMRNKEQKEKIIKSPYGDKNKTYLNFVKCIESDEKKNGVLEKVKEIVATIPTDQTIMLLGRYNYDAMSVGYTGKIDMKDNRIITRINGRNIPFMSVHSAKGLEADHVILVNCNQGAYGFPALIEDDPILDFVLSKSEAYPFAEERRLFYVAMTRARMRMYVLYDHKKPSPFISEFLLKIETGSYMCPRCLEGKMEAIKEGVTSNGEKYKSFVCSNHDGGCDFFETKYGDLTPPGILITEDMTAQDIERLREERRSHRIPRVSNAAQTNFTYGTQAPVFTHRNIQGYNTASMAAPFPPEPIIDELQEGSADDLPF